MKKKSNSLVLLTLLFSSMLATALNISLATAEEPAVISVLNTVGFINIAESALETFPAGEYEVTLYGEFAAYHTCNELSWYTLGEATYNLLFSGPEGGSGYVDPPIVKTFETDHGFGLSFVSPEARYFTETAQNPDGIKHAIVFDNLDNSAMWLLGFENKLGGGDKDYQDMVFSLECVTPPPPPPPPTQYTLTISTSTGGTTDPVPGGYLISQGVNVTVTAVPLSGYEFAYWEINSEIKTENPIEFTMDGDYSLHAVFVPAPPQEVEAAIDFETEDINLQSQCVWVSVYIELPEGFNVSDIDVSTVKLNGSVLVIDGLHYPPEVVAQATAIGDYDGDGVADLMVSFDRAYVWEFMVSVGVSYGNVTLTITGEFHDGTLFKGAASVKVSQLVGDVDCDGDVDLGDLVLMAQAYRSNPGDLNYNPNASFAPPCSITLADIVTLGFHYGEKYT